MNNYKLTNYLFWINFSDLNQITYWFDLSVFKIIWLFMTNHVELFVLLPFVLICFTIWINSFLFILIHFRKQALQFRLDHKSNHLEHYLPQRYCYGMVAPYLANNWQLFLRRTTFVWARGSRTTWSLCSGYCEAHGACACTFLLHPAWLQKTRITIH